MPVYCKYTIIASVSLGMALLITGCIENKASQCQRLIQVVDAGDSLIDQKKGQQVITSFQLSKDLEAITTSLEELNLTDPNLKELQSQLSRVFDNLSQAIAKASKALSTAKAAEASSSGREKLQKARTEIDTALTAAAQTAGKESDALVDELNKYCSQP
jgi:oligoendopeptidase F